MKTIGFRMGDVFQDTLMDRWAFSLASLHNDLSFLSEVASNWSGSRDPIELTRYFYSMRLALALTYEGTSLLFHAEPKSLQPSINSLLSKVPGIDQDVANLKAARMHVGGLLHYRDKMPGPGKVLRQFTFHYPSPSDPMAANLWATLRSLADVNGKTVVTDEAPGTIRHAFVDYVFARYTERLVGRDFDAVAPEIAELLDHMTHVSITTFSYYVDTEKGAKVTEASYDGHNG